MKHTISVGVLMTDNQDGGYTIRIYPTYEEACEAKIENYENYVKHSKNKKELSRDEILDDFDYECGYLSEDSIEIEIEDGEAKLTGEIYFHCGQ